VRNKLENFIFLNLDPFCDVWSCARDAPLSRDLLSVDGFREAFR
jgi:hypothetical protein